MAIFILTGWPQGASTLAGLVAAAGGRITVLVGGGVTPANVRELVQLTGVREVHSTAKRCAGCLPAEQIGVEVKVLRRLEAASMHAGSWALGTCGGAFRAGVGVHDVVAAEREKPI